MKKMNVIYFICHDIGRELGCYGKPLITPNLDRFAREGICFENAYCNSPASSPSRGCAMTGKYAHVNGQTGLAHMGHPLPENQKTVVDYLNQAGYKTVHIGFSHERGCGKNHYQIDLERSIGGFDDYDSKNAVRQAISFLKENKNSRQPFYLNIGTCDTHISRWLWQYDKFNFGKKISAGQAFVPPYIADTMKNRGALAKFQTALKYMDYHFGLLTSAIRQSGYADHTLVIFTTDHGISGPRSKGTLYGRGVETALLLTAPQIKKGRRVPELLQNMDLAPTILDACGLQIPPEIQGKTFWPLLAGKTYRPHREIFLERNFHGEPAAEKKRHADIFLDYMFKNRKPEFRDVYDPIRSVRTENYCYTRYFRPGLKIQPALPADLLGLNRADCKMLNNKIIPCRVMRPREELFDIKNDPLELVNLAKRREYIKIKKKLARSLENWMKKTKDIKTTRIK